MPKTIIAKNKIKHNNFFYINPISALNHAATPQILEVNGYYPHTPRTLPLPPSTPINHSSDNPGLFIVKPKNK